MLLMANREKRSSSFSLYISDEKRKRGAFWVGASEDGKRLEKVKVFFGIQEKEKDGPEG